MLIRPGGCAFPPGLFFLGAEMQVEVIRRVQITLEPYEIHNTLAVLDAAMETSAVKSKLLDEQIQTGRELRGALAMSEGDLNR